MVASILSTLSGWRPLRLVALTLAALSGCGDSDPPFSKPAPNQFGYADAVFRAAAVARSIAPVVAGSAEAAASTAPAFETFTDFDLELVCPDAPDVRLRLQPNSLFDGVLTRPQGAEPFVDCGGTAGQFDADIDVFADLNRNASFDGDALNPEGLEPFDDVNGNRNFDAIWMGGFDSARAALGVDVDNPPEIRVLALSRGQEFAVLVSLDTIGNVSTHLAGLRQRIANAIGLDGSTLESDAVRRIVISSLHNHEAADTLGVAGPTASAAERARRIFDTGLVANAGAFATVPLRSGINFAYRDWMDDQVISAVQEAIAHLRPAEMRVASAPAPMQEDGELLADHPDDQSEALRVERSDHVLMTDIRWPFFRDPEVLALQLRESGSGAAIATLVDWANHVEVLGSRNNLLSADYAGYVRRFLESEAGGVGIFLVGAVGGLQTPLQDAFVPVMDAGGRLQRLDGGSVPFRDLYAPVLAGSASPSRVAAELLTVMRRAANDSSEKAASLGRLIGAVGSLALQRKSYRPPLDLHLTVSPILVPLENPILYLAAVLGVVEGRESLVKGLPSPLLDSSQPQRCGAVGCLRESVTLIDLGEAALLTAPGELLPEYVIGRPRAAIDQDAGMRFTKRGAGGAIVHDFGRQEFAPIAGLRAGRSHPLFIVGLAQTQLGYLIPRSDFVNVFEGFVPPLDVLDSTLGFFANLDVVRLADLSANPGFAPGETLTIREIVANGWAKFPAASYPAVTTGGVSLVDLPDVNLAADHPNTIGNNNSLGPRVGHIVYNAMCDLADDGRANRSCRSPLEVEDDPNG